MQINAELPVISVFVAQAEAHNRSSTAPILNKAGATFQIVGQAANGRETVRLIEQLKPNVALLSVCFTDLNGIEVAKEVKQKSPGTKVIMLTSDDCIEHILAAFDAGADGYLLHGATSAELSAAVLAVNRGCVLASPDIAKKVLDLCKLADKDSESVKENCFGLTNRELRILGSIAEASSNEEIARSLGLTIEIVNMNVWHIMEKLAVSDRTQAIVKALKNKVFCCQCYARALAGQI